MKQKDTFKQWMAAVAIALPALGILALTGCTNDETFETPATGARTVTFTAVAPEGAGSRALWNNVTSGKLGFEWEAETDTKIDLYWAGATEAPLQPDATLGDHSGASVTITGTAPEGATQVVALFPAGTIQVGNAELYRTLPTALTQVGASTAHLRNYMYLNGTLAINEVTEETATMQLAHGCAVLRFNVMNGGRESVRVTKVQMLAASGKTGVNTRAAITANAGEGIVYSNPQSIAVTVQNAENDTKGYELLQEGGSLSVYAHCFPTAIEDGQFLFCITVTDEYGENEKTYITQQAFSAANITTTDDTDTEQKMFKAGYYYTFNLDIASTSRFEELQGYIEQKDKNGNLTGYIVNTYAGLQAWREAVMNENGTMKDEDLNLTLGMDITMPAVAEGESNWTPVGGSFSNNSYQEYTGTINGAGHTISGLVINSDNQGGNGFIGKMSSGSIINLKLADVSVTGSTGNTGALVGNAQETFISDCEVTGEVTGTSGETGGLVGDIIRGSITSCINRAAVTTSGQFAGGIAGNVDGATISGCENHGSVTTSAWDGSAGGIAGNVDGATISKCKNHGSVTATEVYGYAGGMVGFLNSGEISSCENYSANIEAAHQGFMVGRKANGSFSGNSDESGSGLDEYGDTYY